MAKFVRWYDKDENLSAFLAILEKLPPEVQDEVAMDIMLNLPNVAGDYLNDYGNNLARVGPSQFCRWYDFSPTCHSAIEILRQLNSAQREEIITSIADIILRSSHGEK